MRKKTKIIEILIVVAIFLVGLAFVFCCKDKAEAYEPGGVILGEPNDRDVLIENPNGDYIWVEDEINESEVTFELAGGDLTWADSIYLEVTLTDEPIFEDGETRIYLYQGDDFDIVIEKKEPNEPLLKIETEVTDSWLEEHLKEPDEPTTYAVSSDGEIFICIANLIPTWPDYIELEKDLVIDMRNKNDPNYPASYYTNWEIPKGAKIYFKED